MAADPIDLCSLASAKRYLGSVASVDDDLLQSLITGASRWMADYCNTTFTLTSRVAEGYGGSGGASLFLRGRPVVGVTKVVVNDEEIPPAPSQKGEGWVLDQLSSSIRLRGYTFTRGTMNVAVDYTSGFAVCPPSLERACVEIVAWRYKEKDRVGQSSKGVGGETVSFSMEDAPMNVITILNQHRRVVPA